MFVIRVLFSKSSTNLSENPSPTLEVVICTDGSGGNIFGREKIMPIVRTNKTNKIFEN